MLCELYFDGQKVGKTKVVKDNYNPVWKEYFQIYSDNPAAKINLVLMDKDVIGKDDRCGDIVISSVPCTKSRIKVENVPASMIHSHEDPIVIVSVGRCFSYQFSKSRFSSIPGFIFDDNKHKFAVPVANVPIYFCVEYENINSKNGKADLELSLLITDKDFLKSNYVDFAWLGRRFSIKRRSFASLQPVGKFGSIEYYHIIQLPDIKIHNLALATDLLIRWGAVVEKDEIDLDKIVSKHGWKGAMSYDLAKKKLHDCTFDDAHRYINFEEKYGTLIVDYDKDNVDYCYYIYSEAAMAGVVPDMACASESKRTITFYPQGFMYNGRTYTMKVSLDDLPYGTKFSSILLTSKKVQIASMAPFFSLFPITTVQ